MKRLISALRRLLRWLWNPRHERYSRLHRSIISRRAKWQQRELRMQQWAKDHPDEFQ